MHRSNNPTAKKRKGSGADLRCRQKFLLRLFEKTGDETILQQLEDVKFQLASSSSRLYNNVVNHDTNERASHLVEPIDLHSYIALHPQLRRDRFGLPCYGPDFQTPGQFYVDMFQIHRMMLKADYYQDLPEETRNCREYAILNRLIMNADCRLQCIDKQFESADALLTELENLQRSGKLPNLIQHDDEHMEAREQTDPAQPLLVEADIQRTVVQTYCATSETVNLQQPSTTARLPTTVSSQKQQLSHDCDFVLGNWAEETEDLDDVPPLVCAVECPGEENIPPNGLAGRFASRCLELGSRPAHPINSSNRPSLEKGTQPKSRAKRSGQRQLRAAYKSMIRSSWVETLMERYNVGGPGPP